MRFYVPSRRLLLGTLLLLFGATVLTMRPLMFDYVQVHRFHARHVKWTQQLESQRNANQSYVCHIPNYDPFDASIMEFVKDYQLRCPNVPFLTYVDEHGFIHLNDSGFDRIHKKFEDVKCVFCSLKGVPGKKNEFAEGKNIEIPTEPLKIKDEIIKVRCEDKKTKKTIYETCHFQILPPDVKLRHNNVKLQEEGRSNILLLAIDSMSRLSFIRNMPRTYGFLTNQLQSVIMRGLNKVGLNTQPNMIPFLSGYKMYEQGDNSTPAFCKSGALCKGYFDDKPIVWNNFSHVGYVTMWLDEWLESQLFYFNEEGFLKQPTDYFPRPLFQGLEKIGTSNRGFCFGHTPTFEVVLDYTEKFIEAMNEVVYFAFPFIARISHDDANTVKAMDSSLHDFLERLHSKGKLDNTILVLFGDHGLRFGPIRKTLIGTLEDRMPFMSIHLPKKLREQKPHLQAGLEVNSGRLLSWFDMYEMLMDLAMNNLEEVSRVPRWGFNVGLSPFRPFPENRTCEDAGIPLEYCVCMNPVSIPITEDGIPEMAEEIIKFVNLKLKNIPNQPCAEVVLDKIESAEGISHSIHEGTLSDLVELVRIAVWTVPNNALFQATLARKVTDQHAKVLGYVERLNRYGNQSACLEYYPDKRIHPYCLCLGG